LDAVKSSPGTNATKVKASTGLSMGTVRSRLTQLADEGLIRREGSGAKTSWHPIG
jgi:DNA-binding IclR family transcriptional regulator